MNHDFLDLVSWYNESKSIFEGESSKTMDLSSRKLKKLIGKPLAVFLCAVFLLSINLAFILMTIEIHHHCRGEHCKVCQKLEQWETLVESVGFGVSGGIIALQGMADIAIKNKADNLVWAFSTPVSRKVKLLN